MSDEPITDEVPDARFPRIVRARGVCNGDECVKDSRIQVWILESLRRQGVDDAEFLEQYPSLSSEDLKEVWGFVAAHKLKIDQTIKYQHDDSDILNQ